jgi:hypothetical protein
MRAARFRRRIEREIGIIVKMADDLVGMSEMLCVSRRSGRFGNWVLLEEPRDQG